MRGEAGRVRDRHVGPAQRPLQRPLEVAVAGEAQAPALRVADPQPLDRRRRRWSVRGSCHGPTKAQPLARRLRCERIEPALIDGWCVSRLERCAPRTSAATVDWSRCRAEFRASERSRALAPQPTVTVAARRARCSRRARARRRGPPTGARRGWRAATGHSEAGHHDADRADHLAAALEDRRGRAALPQHRLLDLGGERAALGLAKAAPERRTVGHGLAGHAEQRVGSSQQLVGGRPVVRQDGLAERAHVRRDHDAHLGHLPRAVRARLVVDDHHVAEGEHAGPYGEAGALGEVLATRPARGRAARASRGTRCRDEARSGRGGSARPRPPGRPSRAPPAS